MARKTKVKVFDDLGEALRDALAFERGREVNLRVTEVPAPPRKHSPRRKRQEILSLFGTTAPRWYSPAEG
ncbi:MAG: hypothetical protein ACLQMT_12290 [Candidatus Acidiferrales bacterium]